MRRHVDHSDTDASGGSVRSDATIGASDDQAAGAGLDPRLAIAKATTTTLQL
jgi:hypothetical protein